MTVRKRKKRREMWAGRKKRRTRQK